MRSPDAIKAPGNQRRFHCAVDAEISASALSASLRCACQSIDRPVSHHAGGIPEQAAHRAPTVLADRLHQRLLCPAPLGLSVLDQFEAFLRERDDAYTLVGAGATV